MLTEEQLWEIFNADVSAAIGADKAKGGVMAMAAAVRIDALAEAANTAEQFRDGNPEAWDSVATTAKRIAEAIRLRLAIP